MSTDRDHKIEKINAYQKLLGVTLKKVSQNDMVQAEVQIEFIEFLNDQLNELMGNENDEKLTGEEIAVLKLLVANAQKKALGTPSKQEPSQPLNKSSGTTVKKGTVEKKQAPDNEQPQGYVARNPMPPLGNRKMEGTKASPNQSILDQLDEMDRKFENEF
jgi:hypothetical protein